MSNELELNKDRADADRYYKLFANKAGKFEDGERILFIHIGNFDVLDRFIQSNKNCNYFIIDQYLNGPWFKMSWSCKFIGTNEDESIVKALETLDMKFDKIIMNPPYSKNLHLKVLAKAIEKLDDNGTCVNLSPIRWLQDPLAKYKKNSDYKKFEDSISKHIKSLNVCESDFLTKLFQACMTFGIAIYTCNKKGGFNYNVYANPILDKVMKVLENMSKTPVEKYNYFKGCFVPVIMIDGGHKERGNVSSFSFIRGGKNYGRYFVNGLSVDLGKTLEKCKEDNRYCTNGNVETWPIIKFKSEKEVANYANSTETTFFKYIYMIEMVDVNVHPEFLPWMGDEINPRTGKKGYESEWTNEDFYKYFGITEDEQKLIEKTMENYK